MNCSICLKDLTTSDTITLPCSCTHCDDCLTTWMVSQIQEPSFQIKQTVICMTAECKQPFSPEKTLSQFSSTYREVLSDALTGSYITNAPDLRRCPKGGCSYAGVIALKNPCKEPLECEVCGFQWRDPTSLSGIERISMKFRHWEVTSNELLSTAWEYLRTRTCEKCNVNIQKNGGCPHMTCKKCSYEFCWYCGMAWKGHEHKVCYIVILGKMLVVGFPIFHILGLFRLLPYIFLALGWILFHIFQGFVMNSALMLSKHLFTVARRSDSNKGYWGIGVTLSMLLFYVYYLDLGWTMLGIAVFELLGLGILIGGDKYLKIWLRNVF